MKTFIFILCVFVAYAQITCPDIIENNIKWSATTVESEAVVASGVCLTGYKASNNAELKRTCDPSGSWAAYDSMQGECTLITCPAETKYNYQWPSVQAGKTVTVSCPQVGDSGSVQRKCLLKANPSEGVWDNYILDTCNYLPITNIEYPSSSLTLEQMQNFPDYFKPVVVDGFYTHITITPALPQNVKLDTQTGKFTGRFIDPLETTTYTLTFSNTRYSLDVQLTFTVTAVYCEAVEKFGVIWPRTIAGSKYSYDCTEPNQTGSKDLYCLRGFPPKWSDFLASDCISSAPRNVIYPSFSMKLQKNIKVADFVPMYQGVVSRVYALDVLPAGVTLDSTTGTIAGKPTRVTAAAAYRIRFEGTSEDLFADVTLTIEVLELTCDYNADTGYIFPESNINTVASGLCPLGFSGTVTRECLSDGEWADASTIVANCERNYCPETSFTGDNGAVLTLPRTLGYSDVVFNCTYGSTNYHCRPDGTWTLSDDTCKRCPASKYLGSFEFGTACVDCPTGLECPVGSSYRSPLMCTGVFYNDVVGATECKQCDLDTSYVVSSDHGNTVCVTCIEGSYPYNGKCVANLFCPAEGGFDEIRAGLVQSAPCSDHTLKGYAIRSCNRDDEAMTATWGYADQVINCRPFIPAPGIYYYDLTYEIQNLHVSLFNDEARLIFVRSLVKGYTFFMYDVRLKTVEGFVLNGVNYVHLSVRISTEVDMSSAIKAILYKPIASMYTDLNMYDPLVFNRYVKIVLKSDYTYRYSNMYCYEDNIWTTTAGAQLAYASCAEVGKKGYIQRECRYVWGSLDVYWRPEIYSGCLKPLPPTGYSFVDTTFYFINLLPYVFNCDYTSRVYGIFARITDAPLYEMRIHTVRNVTMNKLASTSLQIRYRVLDESVNSIVSNLENSVNDLYGYLRAVDSYRFHPNFRVSVELPIPVTSLTSARRYIREASRARSSEWTPSI